jgi:hypothetical protein
VIFRIETISEKPLILNSGRGDDDRKIWSIEKITSTTKLSSIIERACHYKTIIEWIQRKHPENALPAFKIESVQYPQCVKDE